MELQGAPGRGAGFAAGRSAHVIADGTAPGASSRPRRPSDNGASGSVRDQVRLALPQNLTVTFWDPRGLPDDDVDRVLRVRGRRVDSGGRGQQFVRDEPLSQVPPGQPFAITTRVREAAQGQWEVDAAMSDRSSVTANRRARRDRRSGGGVVLRPAAWSWRRWSLINAPGTPVEAGPAPLAQIPCVARGSWAVAVAVALVVALATQLWMLDVVGAWWGWSVVSVGAVAVGALGARCWYGVLHRDRPGSGGGWAVQGFVAGLVGTLGLALLAGVGDTDPGVVLDASAPGLLLGLGIGRVGCFFSGCCSGRPTGGRWGVLSSDRRLLTRRLPTQLYEAATSVAMGGLAASVVLLAPSSLESGVLFVTAVALHVALRQLLLPWRAEARRTRHGRTLVLGAALLVTLAMLVLGAVVRG